MGNKVVYFSYPYSKVQYFGIETPGVLDIDSELVLVFANGAPAVRLQIQRKHSPDQRPDFGLHPVGE